MGLTLKVCLLVPLSVIADSFAINPSMLHDNDRFLLQRKNGGVKRGERSKVALDLTCNNSERSTE